jgi:hypothetical protein
MPCFAIGAKTTAITVQKKWAYLDRFLRRQGMKSHHLSFQNEGRLREALKSQTFRSSLSWFLKSKQQAPMANLDVQRPGECSKIVRLRVIFIGIGNRECGGSGVFRCRDL